MQRLCNVSDLDDTRRFEHMCSSYFSAESRHRGCFGALLRVVNSIACKKVDVPLHALAKRRVERASDRIIRKIDGAYCHICGFVEIGISPREILDRMGFETTYSRDQGSCS